MATGAIVTPSKREGGSRPMAIKAKCKSGTPCRWPCSLCWGEPPTRFALMGLYFNIFSASKGERKGTFLRATFKKRPPFSTLGV